MTGIDDEKTANPCIYHNHVNRKLFQREAIFSIDLEAKMHGISSIMRGRAAYYDYVTGRHYFSVSRNERDYPEVIMTARKLGLEMTSRGDLSWISYSDPTVSDEKLSKPIEGRELRFINEAVLYPLVLYNRGREVHFLQYATSAESDVSDRLLAMSESYLNSDTAKVFRVEKVSEAEEFTDFLRYGDLAEPMVELELSVPYEGPDIRGIMKGTTTDVLRTQFLIESDSQLVTVDLPTLAQAIKLPQKSLLDAFSAVVGSYAFTSYFEGICSGEECTVRWIFEERFSSVILSSLAQIVSRGGKVILKRYEKLNEGIGGNGVITQ